MKKKNSGERNQLKYREIPRPRSLGGHPLTLVRWMGALITTFISVTLAIVYDSWLGFVLATFLLVLSVIYEMLYEIERIANYFNYKYNGEQNE